MNERYSRATSVVGAILSREEGVKLFRKKLFRNSEKTSPDEGQQRCLQIQAMDDAV